MAAARMAGLPRRRVMVWGRVSDEIAGAIEQERELYGPIIPTKSALIGQLLTEAILFRRANRPAPQPRRGVPFPIKLDGWPKG